MAKGGSHGRGGPRRGFCGCRLRVSTSHMTFIFGAITQSPAFRGSECTCEAVFSVGVFSVHVVGRRYHELCECHNSSRPVNEHGGANLAAPSLHSIVSYLVYASWIRLVSTAAFRAVRIVVGVSSATTSPVPWPMHTNRLPAHSTLAMCIPQHMYNTWHIICLL